MVAEATWQTRSFPPPWSVERSDACFIVRDHGGQALAYVYFERGRRAAQLRRCQRPTHIRAGRRHADGQYSSANMMVMTRSVTDGSDGSGE